MSCHAGFTLASKNFQRPALNLEYLDQVVRYRTRSEIAHAILSIVKQEGVTKMQLMFLAHLSYDQVKRIPDPSCRKRHA
jgi:hypothetical protein